MHHMTGMTNCNLLVAQVCRYHMLVLVLFLYLPKIVIFQTSFMFHLPKLTSYLCLSFVNQTKFPLNSFLISFLLRIKSRGRLYPKDQLINHFTSSALLLLRLFVPIFVCHPLLGIKDLAIQVLESSISLCLSFLYLFRLSRRLYVILVNVIKAIVCHLVPLLSLAPDLLSSCIQICGVLHPCLQ